MPAAWLPTDARSARDPQPMGSTGVEAGLTFYAFLTLRRAKAQSAATPGCSPAGQPPAEVEAVPPPADLGAPEMTVLVGGLRVLGAWAGTATETGWHASQSGVTVYCQQIFVD